MTLRFPLTLGLLWLVVGCRVLETTAKTFSAVPSPDGSAVAYLYQEEPPGGALADYYYFVSIKPAGDFTKPWTGGEVVWTAKERQPLYVLWVDDHSLEVLLSPRTTSLKTVRTPSERYSVTTRVLRSTRKSDVAGLPETQKP